MQKSLRLLKIYRTAARYGLGELLPRVPGTRGLAALLALPVARRSDLAHLSRAVRLRLALQELGPIFVKFGQLLSTRPDLVPVDIAEELAGLQDKVAPFDGHVAKTLIETALGYPLEEKFSRFDIQPLASASVAQVHTATLLTGEDVVIKVIRPGIDRIIADDVALLHGIAALVEARVEGGRRLRLREIVNDYEHVIFDELNLLSEAANTAQLRRNFQDSHQLYVPKVYWDYCRPNVLVLERIYGIPVSRIDELRAAGINIKRLAETGVEIFFTQVFNHSFFHADMHPGNVYVAREHKENPQYIALDCAIIGSLSRADQQYLARNLLAIFKQDYRRVAELHVECGWVPPDTSIPAFASTMRAVCEPVFQKPISEISFGHILLQLFRTASRFNMEVQPSLVLLQKTLLNIEGLGKQLYPELDLWQTALPFLENWQRERLSPLANLRKVKERLPEWLEQAPELPDMIFRALEQQGTGQTRLQELVERVRHLERQRDETARRARSWRVLLTLAFLGVLYVAWVK